MPSNAPESASGDDLLAREIEAAGRDPRRRFGRYLILAELGRGGMGAVYRAWDPSLGRQVAIKVMLSDQSASPDAIERFAREARAAGRLKHPGIVAVFDVASDGGTPHIVMDYVVGVTLEAKLAGGLAIRDAVELVRQTALALDYAHSNGIIHRDVKTQNILINAEGQAQLMDFGLARDNAASQHLTATGETMGTPLYMAPEQIDCEQGTLGPGADIYSLGAVLYRVTCGRPPFADVATSTTALFKKVLFDAPTPPRERGADISADLERTILRCLEKEPANRYASAALLAADLGRFLEGKRTRSSAPRRRSDHALASHGKPRGTAADPTSPLGSRRRGGVVISLVSVGLVASAGLVFLALRPEAEKPRIQVTSPKSGLVTNEPEVVVAGKLLSGALGSVWLGDRGIPIKEGRFRASLPLTEGRHDIELMAQESSAPLTRLTVHIDRTAPELTVIAPKAGATLEPGTLTVRGTVRDAGPGPIQVASDGAMTEVNQPDGEPGSFEVAVELEAGEDELRVVATDRAGNETTTSVALTVEAPKPPPPPPPPPETAEERERNELITQFAYAVLDKEDLTRLWLEANERWPDDPTFKALGLYGGRIERWKAGLPFAEEMLARGVNTAFECKVVAGYLIENGQRPDEALELLDQAWRLDPELLARDDNFFHFYGRAVELTYKDHPERRVSPLQWAVKQNQARPSPNRRWHLFYLAKTYKELDKPGQALLVLGEALVDHPKYPATHVALGDHHRQEGKHQQAIEFYRKAAAYAQASIDNPNDPEDYKKECRVLLQRAEDGLKKSLNAE